jgi:hypothetical protein
VLRIPSSANIREMTTGSKKIQKNRHKQRQITKNGINTNPSITDVVNNRLSEFSGNHDHT